MQTFTGLEYLKIDIASNFGLDKKDWDVRLDWFEKHEHELEQLIGAAEEPALYAAGVMALRKAQNGQETGYPISLDAVASGLQILACLSGCERSARLCGVVSTGHREDAYTNIYHEMCNRTGDEGRRIGRPDTKRAIMTSLYSSTAVPKEVFGKGALLETFHKTMEDEAPGAWELNQMLRSLWQPFALQHAWVLPDNFHALVEVESKVSDYVQFNNMPHTVVLKVNQGTKEGRSISPNIVHSVDGMVVREMHRRCSFDPQRISDIIEVYSRHIGAFGTREQTAGDHLVVRLWDLYKHSGFLSARILDYLQPENMGHVDMDRIIKLIKTMPINPFNLISIHDCFRCLPNYGNDLRRQYNQILSEIAASDMLAFIASQIAQRPVQVKKLKDISQDILQADYALS